MFKASDMNGVSLKVSVLIKVTVLIKGSILIKGSQARLASISCSAPHYAYSHVPAPS